MKTFMIVNATIQDKNAFEEYISQASILFKQAGGVPANKIQITEALVGDNDTKMVVIMEFPSSDNIKNVFDSEEYKALIPVRTNAFSSLNVFIGNN